MQVITGKYRAKKMKAPEEKTTRPTLQRAKETLFNMLPHNLSGNKALDVFAGSGQLGLEAISRGMKFCIFNELDIKAAKILTENLSSVNQDEWEVVKLDYKDLVQQFKNQKFELILIDPPYPIAEESLYFLLKFIDENNMLADNGYITGEAPENAKLIKKYKNFYLKKEKNFSKLTRIWQYAKK